MRRRIIISIYLQNLSEPLYLIVRFLYRCFYMIFVYIEYSIKWSITNIFKINIANIFIDLTNVSRFNNKTGVQRVATNIAINSYNQNKVYSVMYQNKIPLYFWARKWMEQNLDLTFSQKILLLISIPKFSENNKIILLDSIWHDSEFVINRLYPKINKYRINIVGVIYDLIPIIYPEYFDNKTTNQFPSYLNFLINKSKIIMCISRTVKSDLKKYIKDNRLENNLYIGYWNLGFVDTELHENKKKIDKSISKIFKNPTYLMVGTIEPRKGHSVVLDAIEKVNLYGPTVNLCVIGKSGWKNDEIMKRLNGSQANVYYLGQVSDEVLMYTYSKARCLIQASYAEGYGLPIIESARKGVSQLLSDLPVFHEVSQDKAIFFETGSSKDLADKINMIEKNQLIFPNPKELKVISWSESTKELLKQIDNVFNLLKEKNK